MIKQRKV